MGLIFNRAAILPPRVSVIESGAGWLDGWSYRRKVTITENSGSGLSNFQVPIDFDTVPLVEAGKLDSDLGDIRVTDSDGTTLLDFYRDYAANDFGNFDNWWRFQENPVLSTGTGGSWDDFWTIPTAFINNSGTYHLYYGGGDTGGAGDAVGLATSTDLISWAKDAGNPILDVGAATEWDDGKVAHLTVIKDGSNWYGWYAGHDGSGAWKIGYATSSDGISWSKYGSNPIISGTAATWDSGFVIPSKVWLEAGTYYMIYWGGTDTADNTTWEIGLATSTDRTTWAKSGSNPVLSGVDATWEDGVLDPDVVKIGDTYYMCYQGNNAAGSVSQHGWATSTNLTSWSKDADNPMANGANTGEWDYAWNEGPTFFQDSDGTWYMFYMGNREDSSSYDRLIGIKKFKPTRLWVEVPTISASSTATIYIYYGNTGAADVSNGGNTFVFFDDFADLTAWTNPGTYSTTTERGENVLTKTAANTSTNYYIHTTGTYAPPLVAEVRAKVHSDWASEYSWNYRLDLVETAATAPHTNSVQLGHYKDGSLDRYYLRVNDGSNNDVTDDRSINSSVWTGLTLRVPSAATIEGEYHDAYRSMSQVINAPASAFYLQLTTARAASISDYTTRFDKVWIRKYASTEPSASIDDEVQA